MFGYIKPAICLLSEDEKTLYKAVYCGLCHSLGRVTGQLSRFTLSYDFVLLALIQMLANNESPSMTVRRCPVHPIRGCNVVIRSATLDRCAALSALLVHESIRDGIEDEKGFSLCKAHLGSIPARHFLNKAEKQFPLPKEDVLGQLEQLHRLEKNGCAYPDEAAEVFGNLLSIVSVCGVEDELLQFAVSKMMFHIGKWIYLVDAADDFEKDIRQGKFNPFAKHGLDKERLSDSLEQELSFCDDILSKIPKGDPAIRSIIRNILFSGTHNISQKILFDNQKTKGRAGHGAQSNERSL